jgi:hypothetical protein
MLRRAKTADRTEGEPGSHAGRRGTNEEVARNGRPLDANCDGCGGVQPAVLAAVERGGLAVKPASPASVLADARLVRFGAYGKEMGAHAHD